MNTVDILPVEYNGETIEVTQRFNNKLSKIYISFKYKELPVEDSFDDDSFIYSEVCKLLSIIDKTSKEGFEEYQIAKKLIIDYKKNFIILEEKVYKPFIQCVDKDSNYYIASLNMENKTIEVSTNLLSDFKKLDNKVEIIEELSSKVKFHIIETGYKQKDENQLDEIKTSQYQKALDIVNNI